MTEVDEADNRMTTRMIVDSSEHIKVNDIKMEEPYTGAVCCAT